jgi:hypothetical protein
VTRVRVLPLPPCRGPEAYLLILDRVSEDMAVSLADMVTDWSKPDGCAGMLVFESEVDLA